MDDGIRELLEEALRAERISSPCLSINTIMMLFDIYDQPYVFLVDVIDGGC